MTNKQVSYYLFFGLFFLSGFTGLVYETLWSQYLKLFLGHSAYSQSMVLIIFMGGLAIGSYLVACFNNRVRNMLISYALCEALIGILAISFHPLYRIMTDWALLYLFPDLSSTLISLLKWGIAILLLLPPAILLGATFPLISSCVLRKFSFPKGRMIALLYFFNSLGASLGSIGAGFFMIPQLGFLGVMNLAGLTNIIIAGVVWILFRKNADIQVAAATNNEVKTFSIHNPPASYVFLIMAACLGFASFLYEIAWIRILGLILGNTSHSFELMLSAFILGIAAGSFFIRRYLHSQLNLFHILGKVQLFTAVFALSSTILIAWVVSFMPSLISLLSKTDLGYLAFNIICHGICLLIMLPATIGCGMSFPLITTILLTGPEGEKAVGKVYASNTFGCIIGVLAGFHVIMPSLGLEWLLIIGALCQLSWGSYFLLSKHNAFPLRRKVLPIIVCIILIILSIPFLRLKFTNQASSLYLANTEDTKVNLFHRDGKTATVNFLQGADGSKGISINGRIEGLMKDQTVMISDYHNILAATLPFAYSKKIHNAAVIGMGSGMTTETLLELPGIASVDTIEIEPVVALAAKYFGSNVEKVFVDPRSHLFYDDAKTFFVNHNQTYDLIISFPSQPWVSGVAGLFSEEFYRLVHRFISRDGLFVQWITLYQMEPALIASIIKALRQSFSDYVIFFTDDYNLVLLAGNSQLPLQPTVDLFSIPSLKMMYSKLGIYSQRDLMIRKLGNRRILDTLFNSFQLPANSDFFPVLEIGAIKAMFMKKAALEFHELLTTPLPLREVFDGGNPDIEEIPPSPQLFFTESQNAFQAYTVAKFIVANELLDINEWEKLKGDNRLLLASITALLGYQFPTLPDSIKEQYFLGCLHELARLILPYLTSKEIEKVFHVLVESSTINNLPQSRSWLTLYQAIGERNFAHVFEDCQRLLTIGVIVDTNQNRFLLSAYLLACIAIEKNVEALPVIKRYVFNEELSLTLKFLIAKLNDNLEKQPKYL